MYEILINEIETQRNRIRVEVYHRPREDRYRIVTRQRGVAIAEDFRADQSLAEQLATEIAYADIKSR